MKPAADTIDAIRTALQAQRPGPRAEQAAADYARLCRDAGRRLDAIAAVLAKGGDYQALQLAEQEPPLLDLVAALSFGGEKAWHELCERHQWPVAQRLDAKLVQAVEALYQKGITANHPLYKELRAAASSRDDAKALAVVRTILKLNPADENARSELQRLENKIFQTRLEQLRAALKGHDEATIARLVEELRTSVPAEKLDRLEECRQADRIAKERSRREGEARLPGLVAGLAELHAQGDWRQAEKSLQETEHLMKEQGIDLPTGLRDQWQKAAEFVNRERAAAEKHRAFDQSLRGFIAFIEEVETRLLAGTGLTCTEAAEKDESFVRRWKELEAFQLPVANETLQRLRNSGQELRARLRLLERARRVRAYLAAAAAAVFLIGAAAVSFHAWQAHAYAGELAGYQARGATVPAERLIAELRDGGSLALRWSFLKGRVEEVGNWAAQARQMESQADEALRRLETLAADGFAEIEPATLVRQMEDADKLVAQLPHDLSGAAAARLTPLQTQRDLHLANLRRVTMQDTAQLLAELEDQADQALSFDLTAAVAVPKTANLQRSLASLEQRLESEAEVLPLAADLSARLRRLKQRVEVYAQHLGSFADLRNRTAAVTSFADFRRLLAEWEEAPFAEAAKASVCLNALPSEEVFVAQLLTSGDLQAWQAVVEDTSGRSFFPAAPTETDINDLLELRDENQLNGVWENAVFDHGAKSKWTVWSQGRLEQATIGDIRRWTGPCYAPRPTDGIASFSKEEYVVRPIGGTVQGREVRGERLSATSEMMEALELSRMTDPNGERFQRPLLEVLEKVVRQQKAPPLAKAFVFLHLARMAERRAYAWGLHLSPSFLADVTELRRITGTEGLMRGDWMAPQKESLLGPPLAAFFAARGSRAYLREAAARRDLLLAVRQARLRFGGFVETDLTLRLIAESRGSAELWVLAAADRQPLRLENPLLRLDGADEVPVAQAALPLSPVFFVPVDRRQLVAKLRADLSALGFAAESEPPFFTPP